jgi:hypothetical protein
MAAVVAVVGASVAPAALVRGQRGWEEVAAVRELLGGDAVRGVVDDVEGLHTRWEAIHRAAARLLPGGGVRICG